MRCLLLCASFTLLLAVTLGPAPAADDYTYGPDSSPQPGVPEGKITGPIKLTSEGFAGTERAYSVSVPAQYNPDQPAGPAAFPARGRPVPPPGPSPALPGHSAHSGSAPARATPSPDGLRPPRRRLATARGIRRLIQRSSCFCN